MNKRTLYIITSLIFTLLYKQSIAQITYPRLEVGIGIGGSAGTSEIFKTIPIYDIRSSIQTRLVINERWSVATDMGYSIIPYTKLEANGVEVFGHHYFLITRPTYALICLGNLSLSAGIGVGLAALQIKPRFINEVRVRFLQEDSGGILMTQAEISLGYSFSDTWAVRLSTPYTFGYHLTSVHIDNAYHLFSASLSLGYSIPLSLSGGVETE